MKRIITASLGALLVLAGICFSAGMTLARPADRNTELRPEVPANPEVLFPGSLSSARGLVLAPAVCPAGETTEYGGTYWAADSARWEAIRDSVWTFDTGVGSAIETGTDPNKTVGYHKLMEGWYGIDQTLNPLSYFRRISLAEGGCVLNGTYSLWAGATLLEANSMCFAGGKGYGNAWHMEVVKTFNYPGTGNATLSYNYAHEVEPDFDYGYVTIDTTGTGAADDVELALYTGDGSGTETISLARGSTLRTTAGPVTIKFMMDSDGSYSDEDGLYATTCGAFTVDNVSLTGAVSDFTDFESGLNGWVQIVPTTATGDYSNLVNRAVDLPPPVTFCACSVTDSVLVFFDALQQHPLDQDNIAASPWINLKRNGGIDYGRPGRVLMFDIYAEMPLANYIFMQTRARWYPSVCAGTGLIYRSPWRDTSTIFYFGEAPFCSPPGIPRLIDFSSVIQTRAEQIQIAFGVINLCRTSPFGVYCTGISNSTPWLDNIRLGMFGSGTAPNLSILTFDFFQDNFATDGLAGTPGRIDTNTLKNASTPGPGSILRDTLCARGDGGNTEVRLVFHVRPGPFTNSAALAAWATQWTPEPGLGANWYSARMDTAEQGGTKASPGWMTCFHESDPGFSGTDRTPDPLDPSQNENEILPDRIFTAGSRIDYFVAARYLPGDPRNPGGVCQWYVVPDTTGGRYQEVEILPSSMAPDTTWNCTLYVDHHDDRSLFDQQLEEQGLTAALGSGSANAEGTRYDRFDNETPSSGQLSFGRPIQTHYGATIIQAFCYKNIVWHSGNLSALQLTDEDANVVGAWLTLKGVGNNRFWGSGSGLARSMNISGEPSTLNFMRAVLGVTNTCNTIRDVNCPNPSAMDSTFCIPLTAVAGSHFATTTPSSGRGNGCPDLESFDLLGVNASVATAKGQLNYQKNGVNTNYAAVTNWNTIDVDYKTVLDGIAVGRVRTTPANPHLPATCTVTSASLSRTDNVLDWFASGINCKYPSDGILDVPIDVPRPPAFRAALGNAYPNPMNPTTRIQFTNGTDNGRVTLQIFDVTGRLVKNLVDGKMTAGVHEVIWDGTYEDGSSAPSGMYFYRMTADGGFQAARKLMLMK